MNYLVALQSEIRSKSSDVLPKELNFDFSKIVLTV